MAVSGDVTSLPQDGAHLSKVQPHLLALVKWCVSCVWGVATVLLRRLLELPPVVPPLPPLPPIAALVRSTLHLNAVRRRTPTDNTSPTSTSPHISAVPTVECEVLYQPTGSIGVDIIFVHGLYGSLANTWRQGQWRSKYNSELNKVPLKRSPASTTPCVCTHTEGHGFPGPSAKKRQKKHQICLCDNGDHSRSNNTNIGHLKDDETIKDETKSRINYAIERTIGDDTKDVNDVIGEKNTKNIVNEAIEETIGYGNVNVNEAIDNFVSSEANAKGYQIETESPQFHCTAKGNTDNEIDKLDNKMTDNIQDFIEERQYILSKINIVDEYNDFMEEIMKNESNNEYRININGCDNIDMVFAEIANEENKFVNGDKICDNYDFEMETCSILKGDISQNSKGECLTCTKELNTAYEKDYAKENITQSQLCVENDVHDCNNCNGELPQDDARACEVGCGCTCSRCYSPCWPRDWLQVDYPDARIISINYTSDPYLWRPIWIKESKRLRLHERADQMMEQLLALGVGARPIVWVGHSKGGLFIKQIYSEAYEAYNYNKMAAAADNLTAVTSNRSCLWSNTAGFMFYSVPHRGSSLADINIPPLVARSIELLEMGKDCSEVLRLQERWLRAASEAAPAVPVVRSLVETCRTLMAVLWLRIVSVESADAGIGALCGVSVDHREICKPSSRSCELYCELLNLIDAALARQPRHAPVNCSCH